MRKVGVVLISAAGVFVLVVIGVGALFYVRVYRPIGAPLMAIGGAQALEDRQLRNHGPFDAPASGELSDAQVATFVAVETAVERRLGGVTIVAQKHSALEEAFDHGTLSIRSALAAYGDMRGEILEAKVAQIEAMNQANCSKAEFEWIRRQLYAASGVRLSRLDVSEVIAGTPDATVTVQRVDAGTRVPEHNRALAQPISARLEGWRALAFFGL